MSEPPGTISGPAPLLVGAEWFPDTPGGLNRTFRLLFTGMAEAGLRPSAIVIGPASDAPPGLTVVPPASLPLRLLRVARVATALRSRTEVVDIHFALYGLPAAIVARFGRRPVLVHFHGPWAEESAVAGERGGIRLRAKRVLERAAYRAGDIHVVHTRAFERLLVERYGISPWTVEIVPPAVDLDQFRPGDRARARARFGIPEGARVAVTVRRITPRMGIDDLLRACAKLSAGDARLLVAGRGPDLPRLEGIARELGIEERVRFLGGVEEDALPDLYRAADVCVLPSKALEGFGLAALEALACATPVIVADSGGLPEAVAGLAEDLVVPAGDPVALSARLDRAFAGTQPLPPPELCREYAERFSESRLIGEHARLYGELVSAPSRRRRVVYVDRCDGPARSPAQVIETVGRAADELAHVVVRGSEQRARALERNGVSVEVLPVADAGLRYVTRLARRLRFLNPDLVRSLSTDGDSDRLAARLARVPLEQG